MATYRDDAVVLRTHKLGEADRILTLLTRQNGKVRAVAKGVRRTSSKFGARLEPFMVVDAQFYAGRSLDIVQQADSLGTYGAVIAADYDRFAAANAMAEAADRLAESEPHPQQYFLLVGALRALAGGEHTAQAVLASYLLRAFGLAGWVIVLDTCVRCGEAGPHDQLSPVWGGTVCRDCAPAGTPRLAARTRELLEALLSGDWSVVDAATPAELTPAADLAAASAQHHLERGLRSLSTGGRPR